MKSIHQFIPYCIRLFHANLGNDTNDLSAITFKELQRLNVTSNQLLVWSSTIDIAELYQIYLNDHRLTYIKNLSDEVYYNCTWPWFGHFCQYSFDFNEESTLNEIVYNIYHERNVYGLGLSQFTNLSCYIHVECHSGPSFFCLDWREICDGKVDCLNDRIDEEYCWKLELNECSKDEYRCHNGAQCIPIDFLHDDTLNPDCLDRSDEPLTHSYPVSCPSDPAFRCEEHICRPLRHEMVFSCGDGQCINKFEKCINERSISLYPMYSLSSNCTRMMACLTLMTNIIDDIACYFICEESVCIKIIKEQCPSLFQFPDIPVLFGHVFFVYTNNQSDYNPYVSPLPFLICYNRQLCGHLFSSLTIHLFNDSVCIVSSELDLSEKEMIVRRTWDDLLISIKGIFQGCSTYRTLTNETHCLYSMLYRCLNSSTCISKHRLLDGIQDCHLNDDEIFNGSCSLSHKYRFQCLTEDKCISSIMVQDSINDCPTLEDEEPSDSKKLKTYISFPTICDGFQELSTVVINGRNISDETDCQFWPCNNTYTRCDGIWNCLNGADEVNCPPSTCPPLFHMCVSPITNQMTCLPIAQANDGIVNCLGGSDERNICRTYTPTLDHRRFLCRNYTNSREVCVSPGTLCDKISSCLFNDDEQFCRQDSSINAEPFCYSLTNINHTDVESLLCNLTDKYKASIIYFSLDSRRSSTTMHFLEDTSEENHYPAKNDEIMDLSRKWRCNRGLPIRTRQNQLLCLCPPSYYGDICQYQNQRVSLTIQLRTTADYHTIFTIVIMLIDNENDFDSYELLNYLPIRDCGTKFNIYLLYSTRPKEIMKNYSVRIDVFVTRTLEYRASWIFPLEFSFLPVHRLAVQLLIPMATTRLKNCSIKCGHGQCTKYENSNDAFCRCDKGWSGIQCLRNHNECNCPLDSICIGPRMCLCPFSRYGKYFLLTQSICSDETCNNNGICVPADYRSIRKQWSCICNEGYSGKQCTRRDRKIIVSFHGILIPSSILVHFIHAPGNKPHTRITVFKKIPLDQNSAIIYTSSPFHLVIIEFSHRYHLILVRASDLSTNRTVSIDVTSSHQCESIEYLLNHNILQLELLSRIKYYHLPCQQRLDLTCFYDSIHMCLCNHKRHANCFEFNHNMIYDCHGINYCQNQAHCFQDNATCPTTSMCVCPECYYGTHCQLTTKGLSLSLDAILGYQIRPHVPFIHQPLVVKISAMVTMTMFALSFINGCLSILTFKAKRLREVGCGWYLFILSIVSLFTISMLTLKFWLLVVIQMSIISNRSFLFIQCILIEFLLQSCLRLNDWLSSCVSMERAIIIIKGINFNKDKSRQRARWVIIGRFILTIGTTVHDPIHRYLLHDIEEQRTWCLVNYSGYLRTVDLIMNFCHFIIPFSINVIATLIIIITAARKRSIVQRQVPYKQHLRKQFREHRHLLISSMILVIWVLPRLIISFLSDCMKSARDPYLFLIIYYASFIPPTFVFVIFVLPSQTYRDEFVKSTNSFLHFRQIT
ncbi:unnamed protein product [Rotaria sordida]|uniref:Uncharacterized protein n=1 Tax=Rotaria sordida TaxID=392033 RepID=A0A814L835_9BILA|nr:unnamed protein product [Rotaria sordida]